MHVLYVLCTKQKIWYKKDTDYARQDDCSFYYLRRGKNAAVTLI